MAHSNQIQEFLLTDHGIDLIDIYTGSGETLTGSARVVQEAEDKASELGLRHEAGRLLREQERKRKALEAKIAALRAEFDAESEDMNLIIEEEKNRQALLTEELSKMNSLRNRKPSENRRTPKKREWNKK